VFLSKVPNCKELKIKNKDAPGPGYYEKTAQESSFLSDHKRSISEAAGNFSTTNNNANKANSNFLSTTKREDFWVNRIDAPYTHPTNF